MDNQQQDEDAGSKKQIFISYQWDKQTQILTLYNKLTSLGYSVWLDVKVILPGQQLFSEIDKGIRGCTVFLSCVTDAYAASENSRKEVALVSSLKPKKTIIPLKLEKATKWPPVGPMGMHLSELTYAEFYEPSEDIQNHWNCPQFARLVEKIDADLKTSSAASLTVSGLSDAGRSESSVRRAAYRRPNSLRHVIPGTGFIYAVTLLENQLFVIRSPTNRQIEVYNTTDDEFQLLRYLRINDLGDKIWPALVACHVHRCLYVADYQASTIHRLDLLQTPPAAATVAATGSEISGVCTDELKTTRWMVDGWPSGLSITPSNHNVLVTCTSRAAAGRLIEFTSRGEQVRVVALPINVVSLHHAVQLPADTSDSMYVISHGVAGSLCRVCIVRGDDGSVVASYGSKPGAAARGQLNGPRHLVIDAGSSGSGTIILVADKDNNRIVALDSRLNRPRCLPLSAEVDGGLQGPRSLCFEETTKRLYVGERDGGRVLVFDNVDIQPDVAAVR